MIIIDVLATRLETVIKINGSYGTQLSKYTVCVKLSTYNELFCGNFFLYSLVSPKRLKRLRKTSPILVKSSNPFETQ